MLSLQIGKSQSDWLLALCAYIEAHIDESLTLGDLCVIAALTPRALQYAFRVHLNTTPMRWVREQKLKKVNQLLKTQSLTITVTQAATTSGFTNLGIFSRYYSEQYGEKPSQTLRAI